MWGLLDGHNGQVSERTLGGIEMNDYPRLVASGSMGMGDEVTPEARTYVVEGHEVVAIWMPFEHINSDGVRCGPGVYWRTDGSSGFQADQGHGGFAGTWDFLLPSLSNNLKAANGERPWG